MSNFNQEIKDIYRLKVPFENIYTSVFLISTPSGLIIVDCAATDEDVNEYIMPALEKAGIGLSDITTLILTHKHIDHAGGLSKLKSLIPRLMVIRDTQELFDGIYIFPMAGHTYDCIGVLDTRTNTLISGDALQGAGVDKYRCSIQAPKAYLETIERIQADKRIDNILFSHAYEPWNKDHAHGRKAIDACLSQCKKYINGDKNESNTCK